VRDEYALLTGEEVAVFLDRESISWGDEWQRRIDEALEGTAFFIPVLTPRYFRSSACRRELLTFAGHAKSLNVTELLLPLLYVDVPSLFEEAPDDEAIAVVAPMQYEDWRELRLEDERSAVYRRAVHRLATRLVEINVELASRPMQNGVGTVMPEPDVELEEDTTPGLVETLAASEAAMPVMTETLEAFAAVLEEIGAATNEAAAKMQRSDAAGKGFAGRLVATRELANAIADPADRALELGTSYASSLVDVDAGMLALIRQIEAGPETDEERRAACELFAQISQLAANSRETVEQLSTFSDLVDGATNLSRELRAPFRQIQNGVQRIMDGQAVIDEWVRLIDASGLDCT
jgi:hypothetical protein